MLKKMTKTETLDTATFHVPPRRGKTGPLLCNRDSNIRILHLGNISLPAIQAWHQFWFRKVTDSAGTESCL
ncbi:hypothetical protein XENTR_v10012669 [Xenopus tropicalis]|nr:hypothetical protein XENTR_v10012669 [Xenopus tropicalis]